MKRQISLFHCNCKNSSFLDEAEIIGFRLINTDLFNKEYYSWCVRTKHPIQNSLSRLGDTKEIKIIVNLARFASLHCCIVIVQSNLMVHYASTMMT